ncbi:hypothetical protein GQ457_17G014360 [Hibiscus cannabinus]
MGHVRSVFHYEPEYKKTWRGKDKAIRKLHGDWDASYNDLPAWINIMQKYNPGTIADLETLPSYMNDRVVQEVRQFHRLFWTFPQCINAFKSCKPIIQVDGTFLYADTSKFFSSQWFKMEIGKQFPLRLHLFRERTQTPASSF